jgi:hypothetical protein
MSRRGEAGRWRSATFLELAQLKGCLTTRDEHQAGAACSGKLRGDVPYSASSLP